MKWLLRVATAAASLAPKILARATPRHITGLAVENNAYPCILHAFVTGEGCLSVRGRKEGRGRGGGRADREILDFHLHLLLPCHCVRRDYCGTEEDLLFLPTEVTIPNT